MPRLVLRLVSSLMPRLVLRLVPSLMPRPEGGRVSPIRHSDASGLAPPGGGLRRPVGKAPPDEEMG